MVVALRAASCLWGRAARSGLVLAVQLRAAAGREREQGEEEEEEIDEEEEDDDDENREGRGRSCRNGCSFFFSFPSSLPALGARAFAAAILLQAMESNAT